jgi:hypothetical protein
VNGRALGGVDRRKESERKGKVKVRREERTAPALIGSAASTEVVVVVVLAIVKVVLSVVVVVLLVHVVVGFGRLRAGVGGVGGRVLRARWLVVVGIYV